MSDILKKTSKLLSILWVGLLLLSCSRKNITENTINPDLPNNENNSVEISIRQEPKFYLNVKYQLEVPVFALDFGPARTQLQTLTRQSATVLSKEQSLSGPIIPGWEVLDPNLTFEVKEGEASARKVSAREASDGKVSDGEARDGEADRRRILLVSKDGKAFHQANLRVSSVNEGPSAQYQSIYRFGGQSDGESLVFYSGYFWPFAPNGQRMETVFNVNPLKAKSNHAFVSVYGQHSSALYKWQSQIDHPAFIYLGSGRDNNPAFQPEIDHKDGKSGPYDGNKLSLVFDESLPDWIKVSSTEITQQVYPWLEEAFAHPLELNPTLFMTINQSSNEQDAAQTKGFIFSGDALPGQIMVTLTGQAWQTPSNAGHDILKRSITHEIVHLWQTQIRPSLEQGKDRVPSWIHEGAADAIAVEALMGVGLWDEFDGTSFYNETHATCVSAIAGQTIRELSAKGNIKAVYACGHILALLAVSGPINEIGGDKAINKSRVTAFWRHFIEQTLASGEGYSLNSWLDLVDKQSTSPYLASGLKSFIDTPSTLPASQIHRLQSLGGPLP